MTCSINPTISVSMVYVRCRECGELYNAHGKPHYCEGRIPIATINKITPSDTTLNGRVKRA